MSGQLRDSSPVVPNLLAEIERTGVTNAELARAIGVSERQITRWRGGMTPRDYATVERIASYFGRPTEWFYTRPDEPVAA